MKLERAVFKYIEHELYGYDETVRQLELLKEDIRQETPFRGLSLTGTDSGHVSKPTERKGVRLVTNKAILHMERIVRGINRALGVLTEEHNDLYELKYRQQKTWQQVCNQMPTSRRSYFRLRREIVEAVALELGLAKIV